VEDTKLTISADFPYQPNFVDVLGAKMHYVDHGSGDPVVFLHGIPTSSYLWRNIIPYLAEDARCIAPDLIGLGKSAKPNIGYRIFDHIRYIDELINQLNLENITLVLHGWGSLIGFDYARRYSEKIKGIAFLESHIRPPSDWAMVSLPIQELSTILNTPDAGYDVIMNSNYFVNKVLPSGVLRKLSEEEMNHYREPFRQSGSALPLWQYLQDLPLGNEPKDVIQLISDYSKWLQLSKLPKLMMYAVPGFITTISTVQWAKDHLPNLSLIDVGDALHYAQESKPDEIGEALQEWYCHLIGRPLLKADQCADETLSK